MAVLDLPLAIGLDIDLVGDYLDLLSVFLADEVGQDGADEGRHATGDDDDRDVVLLAVAVEVPETDVKSDV